MKFLICAALNVFVVILFNQFNVIFFEIKYLDLHLFSVFQVLFLGVINDFFIY